MIIQCEKCRTKFRLDDSRVTDKGVKVRCAKCRHIFTVEKERTEAEPQADFGALLDQSAAGQSAPFAHEDNFDPFESQPEAPATDATPAQETVQSWHSDSLDQAFSAALQSDAAAFAIQEDDPFSMNRGETEKPAFETGAISGSGQNPDLAAARQTGAPTESATPADNLSDFDFDFDFEDDDAFADTRSAPATETAQQETAPEPDLPADGFSGFEFDGNPFADAFSAASDDLTDAPPTGAAQPETMPEQAALTDDFSGFGFDENSPFADSTAATQQTGYVSPFSAPAVVPDEITAPATEEPKIDAFDFTALASPAAPVFEKNQPAAAVEQKSEPIAFSAPLAAMPETLAAANNEIPAKKEPVAEPALHQEELPPLSISSRRRQSPLITGAIAAAGLLIASALAFFGYSMFTEGKGKIAQETGKITIRSLDASFVKNQAAGDLLVITGEALNSFKKPRAAIQVKGIVYGANSQILASKDAYAGNPLTKEQLAVMPLDKIEAAMANQFGDSLANLEVAPGKTIPFVIVIARTPADAKDYGVEPLGSTVATGKQ